ncbi:hypothetical protein [Streptomyces sp. Inha503]|uniref:hypothetical protein n=1 Tax=Streptomyces sp. Inha503 TaxID=3383314 RepID=UPI00399FE981
MVRTTGLPGGTRGHVVAVWYKVRRSAGYSPAAPLGRLTGRTDGADLSCPGGPLPAMPALG